MNSDPILDSLRLSPADLERIVSELNRASANASASPRRATRRWTLHNQRGLLTFVSSSGGRTHHRVIPRNISQNGISVLYGGYLYKGARCFVTLKRKDGTGSFIPGHVAQCRHVRGNLHEIGIVFDAPVSPELYQIEAVNDYMFHKEHIDVAALKGSVMLIDPNPADRRLFSHAFSSSELDVILTQNLSEAFEALGSNPDLIIADSSLFESDGPNLLEQLRAKNYLGPLLLLSAIQDPELRPRFLAAGACELLFKPVAPELMQRAVAEFLDRSSAQQASPPIARPPNAACSMPPAAA